MEGIDILINLLNQPCRCGSGKKYKNCCIERELEIYPDSLSNGLQEKLSHKCWFHGTENDFKSWEFPPPLTKSRNLIVPHSAIFFTSDLAFAKRHGSRVAKVALRKNSKILDMVANYSAAEELRILLAKNETVSKTINVEHDYWHQGWKTGDVLRVSYRDHYLTIRMQIMSVNLSNQVGISTKDASNIIKLNSARSLVELICKSSRFLGFDAIYGHEVDRHSCFGREIAQPWLAVLSKNIVSEPEWLSGNS